MLHTYLPKAVIDTLFNTFRVSMIDFRYSKKLSFYKTFSITSNFWYNTKIVSFSDADRYVVSSHKALWKLELFSF